MSDFSKPLGDAIRAARTLSGLTQAQIADRINIDPRTVLNIENYKGNPKMEVLYPLIRALDIDPNAVFYPERDTEITAVSQLQSIVAGCSEVEAALLTDICQSVLHALRSQNTEQI